MLFTHGATSVPHCERDFLPTRAPGSREAPPESSGIRQRRGFRLTEVGRTSCSRRSIPDLDRPEQREPRDYQIRLFSPLARWRASPVGRVTEKRQGVQPDLPVGGDTYLRVTENRQGFHVCRSGSDGGVVEVDDALAKQREQFRRSKSVRGDPSVTATENTRAGYLVCPTGPLQSQLLSPARAWVRNCPARSEE